MSKVENNPVKCRTVVAWVKAQDRGQSRKRQLALALLILAALACWLSTDYAWAQLQEGEEVVTVANAYWVRLRSTPEIRPDTILTRVPGGAQLRYLGRQDDWFKVQLPDGAEGWLHARFGRLDRARDLLKVSASVARVRESRELDAPVIGRAIQGVMLEILDQFETWSLVRLPMGEEGWIRNDLVTFHAVEPAAIQTEIGSDPTTVVEKNELAETDPPPVEPSGVNVLEISPLPITAAAEESPVNSAPVLRSHQGPEKPRFLLLFISVVAGLSAFTILLVLGAAAIRRKSENIPPQELPESDARAPAEDDNVDRTYSDPLLKWIGDKPSVPAANGHQLHQSESEVSEELEDSAVTPSPESPAQTTSTEEQQSVSPQSDLGEDLKEPDTKSPEDESPLVASTIVETLEVAESEKPTKSSGSSKSSRSRRRRKRRKRASSRKGSR